MSKSFLLMLLLAMFMGKISSQEDVANKNVRRLVPNEKDSKNNPWYHWIQHWADTNKDTNEYAKRWKEADEKGDTQMTHEWINEWVEKNKDSNLWADIWDGAESDEPMSAERKAAQTGKMFNWWFRKWAQLGYPWAIMCKEFNNIDNMKQWVEENEFDTNTAAADWKNLCNPPPNHCELTENLDPTSNCLGAHFGTGCDNSACESVVCACDSFCCNVEWDSLCVVGVIPSCGAANLCCIP